MEMQEIISFIVNSLLFYFAYKIGQASIYMRIGQQTREQIQETPVVPRAKRIITVEEINGIYYAYDGNDFLAQSQDPDELGKRIADRYPKKYVDARVVIRA